MFLLLWVYLYLFHLDWVFIIKNKFKDWSTPLLQKKGQCKVILFQNGVLILIPSTVLRISRCTSIVNNTYLIQRLTNVTLLFWFFFLFFEESYNHVVLYWLCQNTVHVQRFIRYIFINRIISINWLTTMNIIFRNVDCYKVMPIKVTERIPVRKTRKSKIKKTNKNKNKSKQN